MAHDGSRRPTDHFITDEIAAVTKEKDFSVHAIKDTPGAYLVVLIKKVKPFRIFDSDPSVPLKKKVRIYTSDRFFGFHLKDKCHSAARCGECGSFLHNHSQHLPLPQCPNCLNPAKPGHQDYPARPRVWQGKLIKLTETQRKAVREAGQAAYKAARRASLTPNAPRPEPTLSRGNTTPATPAEEVLPDAP